MEETRPEGWLGKAGGKVAGEGGGSWVPKQGVEQTHWAVHFLLWPSRRGQYLRHFPSHRGGYPCCLPLDTSLSSAHVQSLLAGTMIHSYPYPPRPGKRWKGKETLPDWESCPRAVPHSLVQSQRSLAPPHVRRPQQIQGGPAGTRWQVLCSPVSLQGSTSHPVICQYFLVNIWLFSWLCSSLLLTVLTNESHSETMWLCNYYPW